MKQQAAIVIAALMITSMAFAISTSAVNAAHTPTVEITPTLTTTGPTDFEIEVTNTGGDPITNVEVTLPSEFTMRGWVGALMNLETADVAGSVTLPKGTEIEITETSLTLADNTPVTLPKGTTVTMPYNLTVIVPAGTIIDGDEISRGIAGTPGTSGTNVGTPIELPVVIPPLPAINDISLTVDSAEYGPYIIADGSYDADTIESAINTVIAESGATASWDAGASCIVFTSNTVGPGSSVVVTIGTVASALGFPSLTQTTGTLVVTLKNDASLKLASTNLENPKVNLPADTIVILPAGTKLTLITPASTDLQAGELWTAMEGHILEQLAPDADAKLDKDTDGRTSGTTSVTLMGTGKLVEDTDATEFSGIEIDLPKDTKVVLPIDGTHTSIENDVPLTIGAIVTLWEARTVSVDAGVSATIKGGTELSLSPDFKVTAKLAGEDTVTPSAKQKIVLSAGATATLTAPTSLWMLMPSGWEATIESNIVTWENIEEDAGEIGPGESWTFSIRADTAVEGEHSWIVKTTDTDSKVVNKTLTTTVDSTAPKILEVTMEPYRVGVGSAKIKVVADEPLSSLGNVYVRLDDDPEKRTLISMTPDTERKVWTGTVTIPGNGLWDDNQVDIVILEGSLDIAGNDAGFKLEPIQPAKGGWAQRRIDTVPPCLLAGDDLIPFPENTNQRSQLITGTAMDNITDAIEGYDNLTVKIRVGTTTYETKSLAGGGFAKEINLVEGLNTVKVWVVDRVGNVGPENVQTVFCDSLKPSIGAVSVADTAYEDNIPINDPTPTVALTVKDPGYPDTSLGMELDGIEVTLENAEGFAPVPLENTAPWDKATGRFEIDTSEFLDKDLSDGFYFIRVKATDVMNNSGSTTFWFEVDTIAPGAPTVIPGSVLDRTTAVEPYVTREASVSISGEGVSGDTVNIYLDDETTPTETANVAPTGMWGAKISLTGGHVTRVSVSETDVAGNESAKEVWGYAMSDAKAPAVTLTKLPETTDSASIVISGTVKKDSWEEWTDITLTLQLGTGLVTVPITEVSVNEGSYNYSLSLAEGSNTIVVQAIDEAGNPSDVAHATVERTVTSWGIYVIVLVIVALVMAAIAIFRKKR